MTMFEVQLKFLLRKSPFYLLIFILYNMGRGLEALCRSLDASDISTRSLPSAARMTSAVALEKCFYRYPWGSMFISVLLLLVRIVLRHAHNKGHSERRLVTT